MDSYLNKLKEAASKKKLSIIVGSGLNQNVSWNEITSQVWECIFSNAQSLEKYTQEIHQRDLPTETFFRVLYKVFDEKVIDFFKNFTYDSTCVEYLQLTHLIKLNSIMGLGILPVDNLLTNALKKLDVHQNKNFFAQEDTLPEKFPTLFWINGNADDEASIKQNLSTEENNYLQIRKRGDLFFRSLDESEALLIIGMDPKDFCWKSVYGKLMLLGRLHIPIFFAKQEKSIAINQIAEISGGGVIDLSPKQILEELITSTGEPLSFDNENIGGEVSIPSHIFKELDFDKVSYFVSLLLNCVVSRQHSYRLFEELKEQCEGKDNPMLVAYCLRNMGNILFEQGYMERSIAMHIKAIDFWAMAHSEQNMAEEYVLCGNDYWNGAAPDKAIQYYGEALSFYRHLGYNEGIAEVTSKLAMICDVDEDYDLAKKYYQESLKAQRKLKDVDRETVGLINLSNCLIKQQSWDQAKRNLEAALELAQKNKNKNSIADICQLLGMVYMNFHDYKKARAYYEKVYEYYIKENDRLSLSYVYCNLGHVCTRMEDFEAGIKYYENALDTYEKMGDWQHLAAVYNNLGLLNFSNQDFAQAEEYFCRSEEIFAALGDVNNLVRTHGSLARVYTMKGEMDSAIECYKAIIEMLLQLGDKFELATTLASLSMVYLQIKDYEEALGNLEKAVDIYDALGLKKEKKDTLQIINTIKTQIINK